MNLTEVVGVGRTGMGMGVVVNLTEVEGCEPN